MQQRSCSPNMSFASYEVCRKILTVDLRLGKVKVPTPNSRMNHSDLENSWGIADIRSFKPCVTSFTLTRENVETLKIPNTHETRKYYGFWYFYVKTASILKTFTLASKISAYVISLPFFFIIFEALKSKVSIKNYALKTAKLIQVMSSRRSLIAFFLYSPDLVYHSSNHSMSWLELSFAQSN